MVNLFEWPPVEPTHAVQQTRGVVPFDRGRGSGQGPGERVEAVRHVGDQSEGPSSIRQPLGDPRALGPVPVRPAYARGHAGNECPIATTHGGDYRGFAGDAFHMASPNAASVHLPGCYQNMSPSECMGDSVGYHPPDIGVQAPLAGMGGARPGQSSHRVRVLPDHIHWSPPPFGPVGGVGIPSPYQAWSGVYRS